MDFIFQRMCESAYLSPQGVTTATVVIGGLLLNHLLLRGSKVIGPVPMGAYYPSWNGVVAHCGGRIFLGDGVNGIYSISRSIGMACQ